MLPACGKIWSYLANGIMLTNLKFWQTWWRNDFQNVRTHWVWRVWVLSWSSEETPVQKGVSIVDPEKCFKNMYSFAKLTSIKPRTRHPKFLTYFLYCFFFCKCHTPYNYIAWASDWQPQYQCNIWTNSVLKSTSSRFVFCHEITPIWFRAWGHPSHAYFSLPSRNKYIVKSHLTLIRFRASGVPISRNSHLTIQKMRVLSMF